jgi:hypothetical protein
MIAFMLGCAAVGALWLFRRRIAAWLAAAKTPPSESPPQDEGRH